jgi:hypothetical protein
MAKVELERLSEKGYERCSEREIGWYTEDEMDQKPLLGGPRGDATRASEAFRTVSEEEFCELRLYGVLRSSASKLWI